MKKRIRSGIALLLTLTLLFSLALPAAARSLSPVSSGKDVSALASSVNTLNWALFDSAAGAGNLFYSPYSIASALLLADLGADGNTRQQMESVLGVSSLDTVLNQYNSYRNQRQPATAKLTTANGIWINENEMGKNALNRRYQAEATAKMGATVKAEPFTDGTKTEIREWVRKKTGGMIADYDPILKENTAVDLLNAIYFYGEWATKFQTDNTYEQEFTPLSGTAVPVPMMHRNDGKIRFYEADGFRGAELLYQGGGKAMDLILPADPDVRDVSTAWKKLTPKARDAFLTSLGSSPEQELQFLAVPKFTCDGTFPELKQILIDLGMTDAFDAASANFNKMAPGLYLSDICHRAKLEVDEEGSRASAVTEIAMNKMALVQGVHISFDRPFLYVIRDTDTGMVLFTGVYNTVT